MKTENELLAKAKAGHAPSIDALMEQYKPLVKSKAKDYYTPSGDAEDLIQEGMIGLYKALLGFDRELGSRFSSFAAVCIERQIQTAVKTALRQKHMPLNSSVSLDGQDDEGGVPISEKLASSRAQEPETLLMGQEAARMIGGAIQGLLSKLELATLRLHVEGRAIGEIAEMLGATKKSVDNALQRGRRKVGRVIFGGTGKAPGRNNGRKQKVGEAECV